jgi:hypothetical protein
VVALSTPLGWAAVVYVTIRVAKAAWSSTPEGRARNREAMKGFMLRDRDPRASCSRIETINSTSGEVFECLDLSGLIDM